MGELRGLEGRGLGGAKFPAGAVAAAAAQGQGQPRGDRLSPRPAFWCCGFWTPVSRSRRSARGGATAGAGLDRPPAEVTTNRDPGRRGWAETQPDAPPTLGWLGIRGSGRVGLTGGQRVWSPRPQPGSAKVGLRCCGGEVGDATSGRGAVGGGGEQA